MIGRDVDQGSPLTNFNDRGGNRGSYFIPKKITTSECVYSKKVTIFLAHPKNSLSPVFAAQKILVSFIDPNESLWAKISDQKDNSDPSPLGM